MGAGSSSLTGSELECFAQVVEEKPWSIDDERWESLLRLKSHPWLLAPETLMSDFAGLASLLAVNDEKSHNLSTLAVHVASRLPRVHQFYRTEIEQTIAGVVLLRLFFRHLLNTGGPRALFKALGRSVNGPASGAASSQPTAASWTTLITASVTFLTAQATAPGVIHALTYELHTQVVSLLLTLLSSPGRGGAGGPGATASSAGAGGVGGGNVGGGGEVLKEIPLGEASGPDGGLAALASRGEGVTEPALRALMLLGNRPVAHFLPSSSPHQTAAAAGKGTPSKASAVAAAAAGGGGASSPPEAPPVDPNATLASLLVAALLRNVAVDGGRNEDSDTVGPSPTSSSGKASLAILTARTASLEAYARGDLSGDGTKKPSSTSAALNAVADLATSALTLPTTIVGKLLEDTPDPVAKPLAERSALLLLLLAHNLRSMEGPVVPNPYRDALARLGDSGVSTVTYTTPLPPPSALAKAVPVPFKPLFTALVALGEQPLGVCLLYTLLQSSRGWCEMVLSRGDVDQLLLPLLKQLYSVPTLGSEHRYILLITLLLFTQDAAFCETAHRRVRVPARSLTWFRERRLGDISLGSLLLTCVMRTVAVTSNLSSFTASDTYLHTNCFAAAANMAPYTEGLHPFAAARTLSTLSILHKKHRKQGEALAGLPGGASPEEVERLQGLIQFYDQSLRIGCETLLATCAPASLPLNISLLYALLHDREVVDDLAGDPVFSDFARPLLAIITHFTKVINVAQSKRALALAQSGSGGQGEVEEASARLEKATRGEQVEVGEGGGGEGGAKGGIVPWAAADVAGALIEAAKKWEAGDDAEKAARNLADVKFQYEEDVNPELFFVPYIQSLIASYTPDLGGPTADLYVKPAKAATA